MYSTCDKKNAQETDLEVEIFGKVTKIIQW